MSGAGQGLARRYEAGRAFIRLQNEDARRGEFLRAIDAATDNLNDFETTFVGDFIKKRGKEDITTDFKWFTTGRRNVVDKMIQRYGMRTLQPVTKRKVPQAEPGCCGHLERAEGRPEIVCGAPAVIKLTTGLELCQAHEDERQQNIEKLRQFKMRNMR